MQGLMMDMPLQISALIRHAERWHGDTEIVSRLVEGGIHRYTYAQAHGRIRQLANALRALGVKMHDRVGTLAWNGFRHFETYYAAAGSGAVSHTINPRLFPEQIIYIINHADDRYVFVDLTFVPLVEKIAAQCPNVQGWVILTDRAHMPKTGLDKAMCYEELLAAHSDAFQCRCSTSTPPLRFATPRARPAIPKVCCTVIVRRCCIPTPHVCPTH